jgi:hypothetical protein
MNSVGLSIDFVATHVTYCPVIRLWHRMGKWHIWDDYVRSLDTTWIIRDFLFFPRRRIRENEPLHVPINEQSIFSHTQTISCFTVIMTTILRLEEGEYRWENAWASELHSNSHVK